MSEGVEEDRREATNRVCMKPHLRHAPFAPSTQSTWTTRSAAEGVCVIDYSTG